MTFVILSRRKLITGAAASSIFSILPQRAKAAAFTSLDPASLTTVTGTAWTLSNNNLTAVANDGAHTVTVKSVNSFTTGKYYWETQTHALADGFNQVGVCEASSANNVATHAAVYAGDGRIFWQGTTITGMGTWGTAVRDIVSVAYNATSGLIWLTVGQDTWNKDGSADPATNTGGLSTSTLVQPWKATFAQGGNNIRIGNITTNFGPTFPAGSGVGFGKGIPAGYTAGLPTGAASSSALLLGVGQ